MSATFAVELLPSGRVIAAAAGASLHDLLFAEGVEFPCGGQGRCKGCRVRLLDGALAETVDDQRLLTMTEMAQGWRLACRARVQGPLKLELAQWEASILGDDRSFSFIPAAGLGVAIDLGTTTLVAQLLDQHNGNVLAVQSALNSQARHGADIMSRIEFATRDGGGATLAAMIRGQLERLIESLLETQPSRRGELRRIILVGNTVMHHLFSGLSVEPLSHSPFESSHLRLQEFRPAELGWPLPDEVAIAFLPCLGGFVGSDLLAGVLATSLHQQEGLTALLDLGTNGEIVVGNREKMLCASTAAGPAFEGARISMGMRASSGAVSAVRLNSGRIECHTLGGSPPRGICGSGLVDAVACGLELGRIQPNGRLQNGSPLELAPPVVLSQRDIRELQLAKGAIAAGLRLLVRQFGASLDDVERVHLAGAFGNYISRRSAQLIGLLQLPLERVIPAGNSALLGAKLALLSAETDSLNYSELRARVQHVSLNEDPAFQEAYVEEMGFPQPALQT